jgi:hypothetical protein
MCSRLKEKAREASKEGEDARNKKMELGYT